MSTLPEIRSGPFTRADLDAMPDDGRRHEIIDGVLIVTPGPAWLHQRGVSRLVHLLAAQCPAELEVLPAPFDVDLSDGVTTIMEPDVVVVRVADYAKRGLVGTPPVLAVEVLSPSTRRFDLSVKKSRLADAGCPSYWVVDPDEPSLTVWQLGDDGYVEAARAVGDERCTVDLPFPVDVVPARLVSQQR